MKTCPDCGERVYSLGCVNCDEAAYIEAQALEDQAAAEAEERYRNEAPTWGGYPLTWGDEG